MTEPTGKQLVEWTERDFPGRAPDTRAAHTVGIGARGVFTPSHVVADWTVAEQFNSGPVPVLVRFSNGSGLHSEHDLNTDARGLAVKFFRGEDRETDLVSMTLPLFFVRNGADFQTLSKYSEPVPVKRLKFGWWTQFRRKLQLKAPLPPPPEGVERGIDPRQLTKFALEVPDAKPAVAALSGLVNPTSYGRAAYHSVHAFDVTAPDGTVRPVRYTWEPFLGVRSVPDPQTSTLAHDHLHHDLRRRLANGTISFALQFLVGEEGDDTSDPTTAWPVQRPRITAGVLRLDEVLDDQLDDQERLAFNPTRCLPGFVPVADDLLIQARGRAYAYSAEARHAVDRPVCPVH